MCDTIDQDCNGVIDNDTICYDDDGDGFTEEDGDCDDYQPASFPNNQEIPDGVDNNCDGDIDEGTLILTMMEIAIVKMFLAMVQLSANCSTLSDGDCK